MSTLLPSGSSMLLVAAFTAQLISPSLAQTTVLTGSGSKARTVSATGTQITQQRVISSTGGTTYPGKVQIVRARPVVRTVYVRDNRTYFQRHPKVRSAVIGAGVGTAAGAITGLVAGKGVVRGAAIGAGTGAGVGLVRSSRTLRQHPIIRDVATGTLVGLGIGAAASRSGKRIGQATGVGAAVGLGYGLLKDGLK